MQDDATTGGHGPYEVGSRNWHAAERDAIGQSAATADAMTVSLTAVVLSVRNERPVVMATRPAALTDTSDREASLPGGRFCPARQPSLEGALRDEVQQATGVSLGYLEQLLTDYDRTTTLPDEGPAASARRLSVSYLSLSRADAIPLRAGSRWLDVYEVLPWEDFRGGRPEILANVLIPALESWSAEAGEGEPSATSGENELSRIERAAVSFGVGGRTWDDERVVERFDLLLEAGLLPAVSTADLSPGHVRLVAAGLGRLRSKVRNRPVVFELLPAEFTLFELQRVVEAVLGPTLHKQNFRRLVESTGLVEPTGEMRNNTGGRPAKTFRFRREVLLERPAPGVHVRSGRAA